MWAGIFCKNLARNSEHTISASFYHNGTANDEKRKIKKKIGFNIKQTKSEREKEREGFNAWILSNKKKHNKY